MKMTHALNQTVSNIQSIAALKMAVNTICTSYLQPHPKRSGFFSVSSRHRNHNLAADLLMLVRQVELSAQGRQSTNTVTADDFDFIDKVLMNSGSGSLSQCLKLAVDGYFSQNPQVEQQFKQHRAEQLMVQLESLGF